jgi:hypothetical protein
MCKLGYDIEDRREIKVQRNFLVYSLANQLNNLQRKDLLRNLHVEFDGEEARDDGGLRADLYTSVASQLFNPDFGLFKITPNETTIEINPYSGIVTNHLYLFELAGIMVAKVTSKYSVLNSRQFWKGSL